MPGFFGDIGRGLSEEAISDITKASMRDIAPQFQSQGILDSGTAASISSRTAGDIRRASYEYNLGNKLNLLNLALSGQAQVQQPLLAQSQALGGRLAGLRTITSTGTTMSTQKSMNPFLRSFQTSFGSSLGTGLGNMTTSGLSGGFSNMTPFAPVG